MDPLLSVLHKLGEICSERKCRSAEQEESNNLWKSAVSGLAALHGRWIQQSPPAAQTAFPYIDFADVKGTCMGCCWEFQERLMAAKAMSGGPQRWPEGWNTASVRKGCESWGCSAWRREDSRGDLIAAFQYIKGADIREMGTGFFTGLLR